MDGVNVEYGRQVSIVKFSMAHYVTHTLTAFTDEAVPSVAQSLESECCQAEIDPQVGIFTASLIEQHKAYQTPHGHNRQTVRSEATGIQASKVSSPQIHPLGTILN